MVFSSKISKFGKGKNINAYMIAPNLIYIYYFKDGLLKKELSIKNSDLSLVSKNISLPYNEIIKTQNYLITRLDKNIGIINNNEQNN